METEWEELVTRELDEGKVEEMARAYRTGLSEMKYLDGLSNVKKAMVEAEMHEFLKWTTELLSSAPIDVIPNQQFYENWARRTMLARHSFHIMEYQNKAILWNMKEFARYLRLAKVEDLEMNINCQFALLRGVNLSGLQSSNSHFFGANLAFANLTFSNLVFTIFSNANLANANLRFASLMHSNFTNADISSADLSGANLVRANLIEANLRYAMLIDTNLKDANLSHADFRYANLTHADISFARVNDKNWIANLHKIEVKGAAELEKRYRVNPKKKKFEAGLEREWEGYVIEERLSSVDEEE